MANLFQKIFLSKKEIERIDKEREISQLIASSPILHHSYITKTGGVVRRFSIKTPECHLYSERIYERLNQDDYRIRYTLRIDTPQQTAYATNSDIDKFTEDIYTKIYKIWDKKKQHAR